MNDIIGIIAIIWFFGGIGAMIWNFSGKEMPWVVPLVWVIIQLILSFLAILI